MSEHKRQSAPRPATWQWLAAAGLVVVSIAAGVTSEVIADQFGGDLGVLAWVVAGLACVGAVSLAVLANRARGSLPYGELDVPEVDPPEPDPLVNDLPPADGFIGRDGDVAWVRNLLESRHAVAVVGRRGIGTSSCMLAVANRLGAEFDRVVYLNLRYQGRSMRPRAVLVRLAQVLRAAPPRGGSREALRSAADALWKRLMEQRVLLVLDNVDSRGQVTHLLPPRGQDSRLLLAGGPALANLEQITVHWLAEPTVDEAVELFAKAGGIDSDFGALAPRLKPEVREVVELCGLQPRAIRALGHRAAVRAMPPRALLSALNDAVAVAPHQRLPYSPVVGILTKRDVAYHALSRAARRVCRRLSVAPGALDHVAIAAMSGLPTRQVERVLEELALAAFIQSEPGERYALRPLLAPYAALHLHIVEPRRRRTAAYTGLLRHLARQAERHATNLGSATTAGARGLALGEDPKAWFERHQGLLRNLVMRAAASWPLPGPARRWWFRLAVALCGWYAHDGRLQPWADVCGTVLAVASADYPRIGRWGRNELGVAWRRMGRLADAEELLQRAVAQRGRSGAAQSHLNLGLVLLDLGRVDEAVFHLELARRYRTRGDRAGRALTELALGAAHLRRDPPAAALDAPGRAHHHLVRAANALRALDSPRGFAAALNNLGLAQWRLGKHLEAKQSWTDALAEYEASGDPRGKAAALLNLGAALVTDLERKDKSNLAKRLARAERAYELLNEGRRLREQWPPTAELGRTLLYLGDAADRIGKPAEAAANWARATGVSEEVGDAAGAAEAGSRRPSIG